MRDLRKPFGTQAFLIFQIRIDYLPKYYAFDEYRKY